MTTANAIADPAAVLATAPAMTCWPGRSNTTRASPDVGVDQNRERTTMFTIRFAAAAIIMAGLGLMGGIAPAVAAPPAASSAAVSSTLAPRVLVCKRAWYPSPGGIRVTICRRPAPPVVTARLVRR